MPPLFFLLPAPQTCKNCAKTRMHVFCLSFKIAPYENTNNFVIPPLAPSIYYQPLSPNYGQKMIRQRYTLLNYSDFQWEKKENCLRDQGFPFMSIWSWIWAFSAWFDIPKKRSWSESKTHSKFSIFCLTLRMHYVNRVITVNKTRINSLKTNHDLCQRLSHSSQKIVISLIKYCFEHFTSCSF